MCVGVKLELDSCRSALIMQEDEECNTTLNWSALYSEVLPQKRTHTHRGPKPLIRMFTVKVNGKAVKSKL